jgi:hypothetical protein
MALWSNRCWVIDNQNAKLFGCCLNDVTVFTDFYFHVVLKYFIFMKNMQQVLFYRYLFLFSWKKLFPIWKSAQHAKFTLTSYWRHMQCNAIRYHWLLQNWEYHESVNTWCFKWIKINLPDVSYSCMISKYEVLSWARRIHPFVRESEILKS